MKYKIVLIDADNTLFDFARTQGRAYNPQHLMPTADCTYVVSSYDEFLKLLK